MLMNADRRNRNRAAPRLEHERLDSRASTDTEVGTKCGSDRTARSVRAASYHTDGDGHASYVKRFLTSALALDIV